MANDQFIDEGVQNTQYVDSNGDEMYIFNGKVIANRPLGVAGSRARKVGIRQPLDFEPDTSLGLKLPFNNPEGRLFDLNYLSIDQAVTNLENLLLTTKGERVMHPTFGTRLKEVLFEPNFKKVQDIVKLDVENAISFWLPYILLDTVDVQIPVKPGANPTMIDPMHGIHISIDFRLKNNTLDKRNIVLEIKAD